MNANEITKLINRKGTIVRQVYDAQLMYLEKKENTDEDYRIINDNAKELFCYNVTVLMMDILNNNLNFLKKMFSFNERNIVRMRKDMETMDVIDYPDNLPNIDYHYYEDIIIDRVSFNIKIDMIWL